MPRRRHYETGPGVHKPPAVWRAIEKGTFNAPIQSQRALAAQLGISKATVRAIQHELWRFRRVGLNHPLLSRAGPC